VNQSPAVGISGLSAYVPPYRVCLNAWSEWTDNNPDKIRAVVGNSFRMRGSEQSIYTLAATAVLRLINGYQIDPTRVSFLGFGTESSADNAAGAIIIKGMVNDALKIQGLPSLPRRCEVPEFKHACLGGIYAMKGALRYLGADGAGDQAIVVSADLAQYERGSTGEQTQGSGAVAMLLEENPRLAAIDLHRAGRSSDYRTLDFRKPFSRFTGAAAGHHGHLNDFPIFNGPYSTACYLEATVTALRDFFRKTKAAPGPYLREADGIFMHRPYQRMPETGLALAYLFALGAGDAADRDELGGYCALAGEALTEVTAEMESPRDFGDFATDSLVPEPDAYPKTMNVIRAFRGTPEHARVVGAKLRWGAAQVAELGNLYTASLPAWLAAGFEDAADQGAALDDRELLMIGYGSGDAAEAIPLQVVPGWEKAASKIGIGAALEGAINLDQAQYEALHAGRLIEIDRPRREEFVVSSTGQRTAPPLINQGVEYYTYVP
jgi:hydroxymethylglutaryl-CoA synthase